MTEWTPPPGAVPEQWPHGRAPGDGTAKLAALLAEMRTVLRDLPGSLLAQAGISISPQGMTIDSSLNVTGSLDVAGDAEISGLMYSENYVPGASGWRLTSTGLEVNNVTLRGGIIGNDALADPVRPGQGGTWVRTFGMSTTVTPKATQTISVPAGFSTAVVLGVSAVLSRNTSAGADYLNVGCRIQSVGPAMIPHVASAGAWVTGHGQASRILTGLSGGSITVEAVARSEFAAWGSEPSAMAVVDAITIFLR